MNFARLYKPGLRLAWWVRCLRSAHRYFVPQSNRPENAFKLAAFDSSAAGNATPEYASTISRSLQCLCRALQWPKLTLHHQF